MSTHSPALPIQRALWLDAVLSLPAGLLALLFAGPLALAIGAPVAAVIAVAGFAALYGAAMFPLSRLPRVGTRWPWIQAIGNALWVLASVALTLSPWIDPQPVGIAVLLGQAAIVAWLSALQWRAMRQLSLAEPA